MDNNKKIAKNTLLLYFRMLLSMGVSLYTVRILLDTLGVTDYGIYQVVGGVVAMFSFFSSTMASASQRFFSFELGRNDYVQLKKTFSMTVTIYIMIAFIIFLLAETLGLWFLNTRMRIPEERMEAANWVYQFSILSFLMTVFTIPYNAMIIAYERMKIYAYVSIIEVLLKLLTVYFLLLFAWDKLKLYSVLVFFVTTLVTLIYRSYCRNKFPECKYYFFWNKKMFAELINYSGWNLFGSIAMILKTQGLNVLLNLFFGTLVNAAWGIASQINSAISQFVSSFTRAVNPQITKYYAKGDNNSMIKLVIQSSKFSYFLLLILSLPILIEPNFILALWLKEVPAYVVLFSRLIIINALIDSLSSSLITAALSTGRIKRYQLVVGGTVMLILPASYILLKMGFPPQITLYVSVFVSLINVFLRLKMLKTIMNFPILSFLYKVLFVTCIVTVLTYLAPVIIIYYSPEANFSRFLLSSTSGLLSAIVFIYSVGLTSGERHFIINAFFKKINLNT